MSGKNPPPVLPADVAGIERASVILRSGGLVAVPTETVYGLAARADDAAAVARIFAAKGRPVANPLIVHVASLDDARAYAVFDDIATALADRHWPGPLTLVLPRRADAGLAPAVTAALGTVALRVPGHHAMRALLDRSGVPLAAPSANRSGYISPTRAEHVLASLGGRVDLVLDGGPCEAGLESTIIAVREGGGLEELRPGPIRMTDIGRAGVRDTIEAPGQMASHYAPGKPMRLNARKARPGEFLIGFGKVGGAVSLSRMGDPAEAAARLYDCLHAAAAAPEARIAVAPIPDAGLGRAINDRLCRAATPPGG